MNNNMNDVLLNKEGNVSGNFTKTCTTKINPLPWRLPVRNLWLRWKEHMKGNYAFLDMKYVPKVMDSNLRKVETSEAKPFSRPWKSSDLILKVADREFHVHRAVLILCSPVFEASLSSNFEEKSVKEIPLPGKEATEIEQMLQSIYPDQDLQISKENCLALLKLSTEYQIDRLKKHAARNI